MVGISANFYRLTFKFFADATQVTVQLSFSWREYQRYPMLGAKGDVDEVFN